MTIHDTMTDVVRKGIRVRSVESEAMSGSGLHVSRIRGSGIKAGGILLALVGCLWLNGCAMSSRENRGSLPAIEFTTIPVIGENNDPASNAAITRSIRGRVIGGRTGQRIVVYARSLDDDGKLIWFVQPFVKEPFTKIDADSRWRTWTHPGVEYAALLVEPGFEPPATTAVLPSQGVATVAFTSGEPAVWHRWWFLPACLLLGAAVIFGLHRLRLYQMSRKLHLRFEERLAERTRVAQELHDTLLQGVLSASMQLHVAVGQLPEDSPSLPLLNRVLELMGQVVEEGRNTLRGLRSSVDNTRDLEGSFSRVPQELGAQSGINFRVIVEGTPRGLRAIIRDDVYSIGREALVNAFRHSRPHNVDVQLEYASTCLRVLVRDDGCGIDAKVLASGREGHYGMSGMRERAERIGARLKVLSRPGNGTEVELRVPSEIAFESVSSSSASKWLPNLQHSTRTGNRKLKVG